jgi:hypothetical protein
MNIHKSQLFWCELQRYRVLTHPFFFSRYIHTHVFNYLLVLFYFILFYFIWFIYVHGLFEAPFPGDHGTFFAKVKILRIFRTLRVFSELRLMLPGFFSNPMAPDWGREGSKKNRGKMGLISWYFIEKWQIHWDVSLRNDKYIGTELLGSTGNIPAKSTGKNFLIFTGL